jgi:hypothetical protein
MTKYVYLESKQNFFQFCFAFRKVISAPSGLQYVELSGVIGDATAILLRVVTGDVAAFLVGGVTGDVAAILVGITGEYIVDAAGILLRAVTGDVVAILLGGVTGECTSSDMFVTSGTCKLSSSKFVTTYRSADRAS